jgi:hypothetical protein
VTVNGASKGTFHVTGSVNIFGEAGTNTVTINGTANADAFVIDPADVVFNGTTFNGNSIRVWQVNGLGGDDTFTVHPGSAATINGGTGNNTLIGPNSTNIWSITGTNAGTLDSKVRFTNMQNLVGGTGLDTFKFSLNGKVTSISGGGAPARQGDWLDYSAFTSLNPVTVNLATGSATGVNSGALGAISGIENVIGGAGNDVLTGDNNGNILIEHGGAGTINGGAGRSLLISGTGAATVNGGSGGDILIGGKTSYDTSSTGHLNLMIILAEWRSTDAYSTRTDEITDGAIPGHTGVKLAVGSTVTLNLSTTAEHLNALPSTTDLDWFFASSVLQYSTPESGEIVNNDPN